MLFPSIVQGLTSLLAWWACAVAATSNNYTDAVTWDSYSLFVNDTR